MVHLFRYFFKEKHPEYVQLSLYEIENNIIELVGHNLKYKGLLLHLLYEPQLIGVKISEKIPTLETIKELIISKNNKPFIQFFVEFSRSITLDKETIVLFEVKEVNLHISFLAKQYIGRFYKRALKKNNYVIDVFNPKVFNKLISFFYYPKPVYLISTATTSDENKNSFPVDTCQRVGNYFIFGVRASNKIMNSVKMNDVFAISLSDFHQKDNIYQLGNYSSKINKISHIDEATCSIKIPDVVSPKLFQKKLL